MNGLDLFKDFYDLSLLTNPSTDSKTGLINNGSFIGHKPLNTDETNGVKAGHNLQFILRTDITRNDDPAVANEWTSIASGEYISIEEVQMDYSRFFVTFKKFAMNLPARVIGIIAGQLDPTEARKLEQDLSREVNGILEAFVVAGTEDKPAKEKKPKRGRPKKTAN